MSNDIENDTGTPIDSSKRSTLTKLAVGVAKNGNSSCSASLCQLTLIASNQLVNQTMFSIDVNDNGLSDTFTLYPRHVST